MKFITKLMVFGLLVTSLSSFGSTYSYFSDTECSVGNTITVGVWDTQADSLEIDVSKAYLTGEGDQSKLHGVCLENVGDENIIIDKIQVGWNISRVDSNNILLIKLNGETIFRGCDPSGRLLDCDDFTIFENSSSKAMFHFDERVSGPFMIDFIMEDGSRKNVYFDVVK